VSCAKANAILAATIGICNIGSSIVADATTVTQACVPMPTPAKSGYRTVGPRTHKGRWGRLSRPRLGEGSSSGDRPEAVGRGQRGGVGVAAIEMLGARGGDGEARHMEIGCGTGRRRKREKKKKEDARA
jgi:hypothetical protein